ncbi:Uncharacterised protein [Staphylococcus aureus]|nr:Uncharacterised protein [Staphylococcus aureus]
MFDDLKIANASLELLGSLMHALSANALLKETVVVIVYLNA